MRYPWVFLLVPLGANSALADDDDDDERVRAPGRARTPTNPTYTSECGSCHYAFPPGLLPGASWAALMKDLPHHFGDDATLAEPTRTKVEAWLVANAASARADAAVPLRITETRAWRHEHDEIPASWAKDPAVRSLANCPACHTGASRGSFREGEIRIPCRGSWDD